MKDSHYDVIGVGVGPFNLGLAALLEERTDKKAVFFDKSEVFQWHPGMLLEQSDLQVPFLADLVTLANPTSQYSFLNYLHVHNRMFQFYFFKRFDVPRLEYNDYCKWVVSELGNLQFGHLVTDVVYDEGNKIYQVEVQAVQSKETFKCTAEHIVVGTGSAPLIPSPIDEKLNDDIIHTSRYRHYEQDFKEARSITVVGSGQSAAEVFYDLLQTQADNHYQLTWFTRSAGFFQLESGKLGQEVFSPDYVDYFQKLPYDKRKDALPMLGGLRNGVEAETLHAIYDLLYHRSINREDPAVTIQAMTAVNDVVKVEPRLYELKCEQWQQEEEFTHESEKVIFATGYKPYMPKWLLNMQDDFKWESEKEFVVTRDYRLAFHNERNNHIFILTNLEHSHGASATNLALSVRRNQTIINSIVGDEIYPLHSNTVFQQFDRKENRS
ncbi:SidA/IucD/PvdA family monooxygenase [Alkalihalophilus lindianensis]|uniref:L-lysine N6-monooxygenase MbtG n=1 Tax=Alkalihalophilus lindianensis TaxID=1630542 RepID=A0ABU3XD64_9BACI|nr:SidA/IucD/PvdA family monooxygenase [Alkalihalophilus lindianensis]MDV2685822.1 SidA/IucD/PvdA family monooxygenase [Alkalihalophilus lindianensis]